MTNTLATELTYDGDTVGLEGGDTLRLRIRPDDIDPFDDTDAYGRVSWLRANHRNDYGERERPSDFDGNAEKLYVDGYGFWWQPPADIKRSDPGFASLRDTVRSLAESGYIAIIVERLSGQDAYQRPIVVNFATLGGVEPDPDPEYLQSIVEDLIAEVVD